MTDRRYMAVHDIPAEMSDNIDIPFSIDNIFRDELRNAARIFAISLAVSLYLCTSWVVYMVYPSLQSHYYRYV
jgi:hypothetical protein